MDAGDRPLAQTLTYKEQPEHDDWMRVRRGALLSDEDTLGWLRGSNTGKATGHGLCSPAPTRRLIPSCISDLVVRVTRSETAHYPQNMGTKPRCFLNGDLHQNHQEISQAGKHEYQAVHRQTANGVELQAVTCQQHLLVVKVTCSQLPR